jgi:hypothetical protein
VRDADGFYTFQRRFQVQAANEPLEQVVKNVADGYLDMDPEYQRALIWPVERKALLIDSLVSGVGMPPIYLREFSERDDYPWKEVLDGKQRLNAIIAFMADEFPYDGAIYSEWHRHSKARFRHMTVGVSTVCDITDEQAWELFRRVNFCGVPQDLMAFEARKDKKGKK